MRQDRRLNGWILIASVIGAFAGLILLVSGGFLGVAGFVWPEKLLKITDLQFFMAQEGVAKMQLKLADFTVKELLKPEFLYLTWGVIAGVAGLIVLILSILGLNYAKKRKVVRRRMALFIFALISLGLATCVGLYLWYEFKTLTDNIKYVCYGVGGALAFVGLCQLLGVIFGRSEKFMSNDNSKYAFSNSSIKNARADINNNANQPVPQQEYVPASQEQGGYIPLEQERLINQRAQSSQGVNSIPQGGQARPTQPMRPAQPQRPMGQPAPRPNAPVGPRPMPAQPGRPMANGQMPPRPIQQMRPTQPVRPGQPMRPVQPNAQGKMFCKKCGKLLAPGEKICSLCGYKVTE